MKRLATLGSLMIILGVVLMQKQALLKFYNKYLAQEEKQVTKITKNNYYRDYNFAFVKQTTNLSPKTKQDLLNIFYTAINSGQDTFTFSCPEEYQDCITEVGNLADDQELLSHINNFVHPFNGFKSLETEYDSLGEVKIKIKKSYTAEEITMLETEIEKIEKEIIIPTDTLENKIKAIHDYIINNSKYDSKRSEEKIINYKSDIAYGPIFEHYGLCGGYTDAMQLFLEKLNIKSFKVSSESHVWNAVNLNNKWYHLDLTWDDPVVPDGSDILEYNFFLIPTKTLEEIEKEEHIFDQNIYQELKEA